MHEDGSNAPLDTFLPGTLSSGEVIACRWSFPDGRGILTNFRCLLLGHSHPMLRAIRWTIDLERITALSVEATGSSSFAVWVNEIPVCIGSAPVCADVQRRIDQARTARCLALYGRLIPYKPSPTAVEGEEQPCVAPVENAAPMGSASNSDQYSECVLFLSGVPWKDLGPSRIAGSTWGAGEGAVFIPTPGGHEAADFRPGQVYGWQAEIGRMVLDIARRVGVSVKVVDVEHSGADLDLVREMIGPQDDLPVLLRKDGRRLEGEESFLPATVERFLRGP